MRLHVPNVGRCHAGVAHRRAQQFLLTNLARRTHRTAAVAVVVHRAAADHRVHAISIHPCLCQWLEHHDTGALGTHVAVAARIAEFTSPVRRHHATLRIRDVNVRLQNDVHTARERQRTLAAAKTAHGQMHRRQPGRAAGIEREARAAESEGIRKPTRHGVASAAQRHREVDASVIREQPMLEVAQPLPHEHTG